MSKKDKWKLFIMKRQKSKKRNSDNKILQFQNKSKKTFSLSKKREDFLKLNVNFFSFHLKKKTKDVKRWKKLVLKNYIFAFVLKNLLGHIENNKTEKNPRRRWNLLGKQTKNNKTWRDFEKNVQEVTGKVFFSFFTVRASSPFIPKKKKSGNSSL